MAAMVKAHSKDNDICYYASLLLAQFEGPEGWSHTTPLPLRVSYTTPLPLRVSHTTPLPQRVSHTTPLPLYQTPHGSPVWSAFRFPSHIPRFHVISVEMADSHILP